MACAADDFEVSKVLSMQQLIDLPQLYTFGCIVLMGKAHVQTLITL